MEELSKQELIEKNKSLIGLLKKAKKAQDELSEERNKDVASLRSQLNEAKETCTTQQEIISSLTENKLSYVTKNESLNRQLDLLNQEVEDLRESGIVLIKKRRLLEEDAQKHSQIIAKQKHVVDQLKAKETELTNKIKEDREKFEKNVSSLKSQYEERQTALAEISQQNEDLKKEMGLLKGKMKEFMEMEAHFEELKKEKVSSSIICKELQKNLKISEEKLQKISQELKTSKEDTQFSGDIETVFKSIGKFYRLYEPDMPMDELMKAISEKFVTQEIPALEKLDHIYINFNNIFLTLCDIVCHSTKEVNIKSQFLDMNNSIADLSSDLQKHFNMELNLEKYQISKIEEKVEKLEKSLAETIEKSLQKDELEKEVNCLQESNTEKSSLEKRLQDTDLEFQKMQSSNAELIENISTLEKEILELKGIHDDTLHELEKSKLETKSYRDELDSEKDKSRELEEKLGKDENVHRENLERQQQSIKDFTEKLDKANTEKSSLEKKLQDTELEFQQIESSNVELKENISTLEKEVLELKGLHEDTVNELERSKLETKSYQDKCADLEDRTKELCHELDSEKDKSRDLEEKLGKDENVHLENLEAQQQSIKDFTKKLDELNTEKSSLEKKLQDTELEFQQIESSNAELKENISTLEKEVMNLKSLNDEVVNELEKSKLEVKSYQEKCVQLEGHNKDLSGTMRSINEELDAEKIKSRDLEEKFDQQKVNLENLLEGNEKINMEKNEKLEILEHEKKKLSERCEGLLQDTNELNQVLKERGEKISRLESSVDDKNKQINNLSSELSAFRSEILSSVNEKCQNDSSTENLTKQIQSLVVENKSMKEEICRLEANMKSDNRPYQESASEVMSTSTISRADQGDRMKDLEDTFEERYLKLKAIALRLKRELIETKNNLKTTQEEKNKMAALCTRNNNIQALQEEIDRCQDELESKVSQLKASQKELSTCQLALSSSQEDTQKLATQLQEKTSKLKELECLQTDQQKQLLSLQNELKAKESCVEVLRKDLKDAHTREASERLSKENALATINDSKEKLDKSSVMELEIRDYESRLESLREDLTQKEREIATLRDQLLSTKENESSLLDQILFLKDQAQTESQRAQAFKDSSTDLKSQLSLSQENEDKIRLEKQQAIHSLENTKQELELSKQNLAKISSEFSTSQGVFVKEKQANELLIESLTQKVSMLEEKNADLENDLITAKNKFQEYKVRAQNVLKNQPKIQEDTHAQIQQEKQSLQAELQSAHASLNQIQCELKASKAELGFVQTEKERLVIQLQRSEAEKDNEQQQYQRELQQMIKSQQNADNVHQQELDRLKSESQAITNKYKAQLTSKEKLYQEELTSYRSQLEEALKEANHLRHPKIEKDVGKQESPVDIANMTREEGEGSEWVEPPNHVHSAYNSPSLDQLINFPLPPATYSEDSTESVQSSGTMQDQQQISSLEKRLGHVSLLLAESESENAKLLQLSDTLKEELRKVARNHSREKHLENNEYIKNILLKFLHLKTGDEKSRLVPVLRTLLQLSPEECQELTKLTSGGDSANSGSQGWGDYLHLWSGR